MTQILDFYGQTCTFYCALGVSLRRRVGKVCIEHYTFLYPTLDRVKKNGLLPARKLHLRRQKSSAAPR